MVDDEPEEVYGKVIGFAKSTKFLLLTSASRKLKDPFYKNVVENRREIWSLKPCNRELFEAYAKFLQTKKPHDLRTAERL